MLDPNKCVEAVGNDEIVSRFKVILKKYGLEAIRGRYGFCVDRGNVGLVEGLLKVVSDYESNRLNGVDGVCSVPVFNVQVNSSSLVSLSSVSQLSSEFRKLCVDGLVRPFVHLPFVINPYRVNGGYDGDVVKKYLSLVMRVWRGLSMELLDKFGYGVDYVMHCSYPNWTGKWVKVESVESGGVVAKKWVYYGDVVKEYKERSKVFVDNLESWFRLNDGSAYSGRVLIENLVGSVRHPVLTSGVGFLYDRFFNGGVLVDDVSGIVENKCYCRPVFDYSLLCGDVGIDCGGFGLAVDVEHWFAGGGSVEELHRVLGSGRVGLVHLNGASDNVYKGSHIDLHSYVGLERAVAGGRVFRSEVELKWFLGLLCKYRIPSVFERAHMSIMVDDLGYCASVCRG